MRLVDVWTTSVGYVKFLWSIEYLTGISRLFYRATILFSLYPASSRASVVSISFPEKEFQANPLSGRIHFKAVRSKVDKKENSPMHEHNCQLKPIVYIFVLREGTRSQNNANVK